MYINFQLRQQDLLVNELKQLFTGKRNATKKEIVRFIADLLWQYGEAQVSQLVIGQVADVQRETANRVIKELCRLGVLTKILRRDPQNPLRNLTCLYKLTPLILNLRYQLQDIIPAFKRLGRFLLHSLRNKVLQQNVTEYNRKNIYITSTSSSSSTSTCLVVSSTSTRQEKESSMERPLIKFLEETYEVTSWDQKDLAGCSDEALQYALTAYAAASQQEEIHKPLKWIKAVANNYYNPEQVRRRETSIPKKGNAGGGFKKGDFKSAVRAPEYVPDKRLNMTQAERITFLSNEISNLREIIQYPQDFFLKKVNLEETIPNFQRLLAGREQELQELTSPVVEVKEAIAEDDMSPGDWLLMHKKRKEQQAKERNVDLARKY